MAAGEKIIALLLKLETDPAAQRKTERDLTGLRELLDKTAKATLTVDQAGEKLNAQFAELTRAKAIDAIADDAVSAAQKTGSWADALERVSQSLSEIGASDGEIAEVARSLENAQRQASAGASGGRRGAGASLEQFGSTGAQLFSGLGQGEAANAVGLVGDFVGALGTLNPVLLGTVALSGAAALALGQLNSQLDSYRQGIEAGFSAQDRYLESVKNLTTEQARQALDAERENNRFLTAEVNNVQAQIWEAWDTAVAEHGEAGAKALWAVANPTAQLEERLNTLRQDLEESDGYLLRMRSGLANDVFAPNDAAEAEAKLAAERERLAQVTVTAAIAADRMTAEERAQQIQQIERQIDLLRAFGGTSESTQQQISALTAEADGLRMVFNSTADSAAELAANTAALKAQTDTYFDALEREGELRGKLAEAGQALQEVNAKAAEQVAKTAAEAEEKRNSIVEESGDQRAELERKSQEAIRKVERDYARTKFRAIGERDSLEARLAQIAREDQLDDQRRADDEATSKLEEAQAKQLRTLEKSLAQQAATQNAALVREQATKMQSYQRAQLDLMNSENYSAAIRAQAINGRVIQETTAYQSMLFQTNYYMNAIVARFGEGLAQMYRQMANGLTPNSPAAYDLYGVTRQPVTQQTVTRTVDYRLNQYFQSAGITER